MQFRLLPLTLLAVVMLAFVIPWETVVIIAGVISVVFVLAYLIGNRKLVFGATSRVWKEYREEFGVDGIIREEEVGLEVHSHYTRVAGRRIASRKRRGRGYMLLTPSWFLVFLADMPLIYIPHSAPDPTFELGLSINRDQLVIDASRFENARFGRCIIKVKTTSARRWLDLLAPE